MGKLHLIILTDHAIYVYISGRFKIFAERNNTELRIHIWQLKDQKKEGQNFPRDREVAKSYTNLTKRCNLCSTEKLYILFKPVKATLNKRNELISTCRHKRKFLLKFNRILEDQS